MNSNSKAGEKQFGLLFTVIFIGLCFYLYVEHLIIFSIFSLAVACTFLICALSFPHKLTYLKNHWIRLGLLLGKIVNPIILGVIFFFLIVPLSLILKLFGRDELRLVKKTGASYWIKKYESGDARVDFNKQF